MRHFALSLVVFGGLFLALPALAHGPAPAVLEVLAEQDGRPMLLRTNVGLVRGEAAGHYSYGCPSQWGGSASAPAAALDDGMQVALVSRGSLYLSNARGCAFEHAVDLEDAWFVEAVTAGRDTFYLLARDRDTDESALVRVVDGEVAVLHRFGERVHPESILADDHGVLIAGSDPNATLFRVGVTGAVEPIEWTVTEPLERLDVAAVADATVWLVATSGGRRTLWRVAVDPVTAAAVVEIGPSGDTVLGPVEVDSSWFAVVDGQQVHYEGVGLGWQEGPESGFSCLTEVRGRAYACALDTLWTLGAERDGLVTMVPVFSFEQLGGPTVDCTADDTAQSACELDWAHFGGEAGWLDAPPAEVPGQPRGSAAPGGCSVATSHSGSLGWVLLACLGLCLRLRRQ